MRILHLIGVAAVAGAGVAASAMSAWAGESAILHNGLRLHAERHEADGARLRLYSGDGGVTDLPAASVAGFEPDEVISPAPGVPAMVAPGPVPQAPETAALRSLVPQELADLAARKFALPESFVRSVMRAESGFQAAAVSPKGAIGLMQLMPGTARALGVNPSDPRENAEGGAQYLRDLLAKYESNPDQVLLALAAYNAGPGAVEKYHGVPPFRETREYILRVLKNWDRGGVSTMGTPN